MQVDRSELRRRLVDGWKPNQTVEIRVCELAALLDAIDELEDALIPEAEGARYATEDDED